MRLPFDAECGTSPPNGVLMMVSNLATKTHRTMHYAETDESMVRVLVIQTALSMDCVYV